MVEGTWRGSREVLDLYDLQTSLGDVQRSLQNWNTHSFGSVRKKLAKFQKELEDERGRSILAGPSRRERRLIHDISELLAREEIMERQRSRIQWSKEGDRNTSFFQAKVRGRAKQNKISSLLMEDSSVATKQKDL